MMSCMPSATMFKWKGVHQGDLWGRAGSSIPRLRSAQGLFVCGKFVGEPAPTGDKYVRIWSDSLDISII